VTLVCAPAVAVWGDIKSVLHTEWKLWRVEHWPHPAVAKRHLAKLTVPTLTPFTLMVAFADLHEGASEAQRRTVAEHWVRHYYTFVRCRAEHAHPSITAQHDPNQKLRDTVSAVVKVENERILYQLSVMLDKPIPSPAQMRRLRNVRQPSVAINLPLHQLDGETAKKAIRPDQQSSPLSAGPSHVPVTATWVEATHLSVSPFGGETDMMVEATEVNHGAI
jgi:hypothetical protein